MAQTQHNTEVTNWRDKLKKLQAKYDEIHEAKEKTREEKDKEHMAEMKDVLTKLTDEQEASRKEKEQLRALLTNEKDALREESEQLRKQMDDILGRANQDKDKLLLQIADGVDAARVERDMWRNQMTEMRMSCREEIQDMSKEATSLRSKLFAPKLVNVVGQNAGEAPTGAAASSATPLAATTTAETAAFGQGGLEDEDGTKQTEEAKSDTEVADESPANEDDEDRSRSIWSKVTGMLSK